MNSPILEVTFRSPIRFSVSIVGGTNEYSSQATWEVSRYEDFSTVLASATAITESWNSVEYLIPTEYRLSPPDDKFYIRAKIAGYIPILDRDNNLTYDEENNLLTYFDESDWSEIIVSQLSPKPATPVLEILDSSPQRVAVRIANYPGDVSDAVFQIASEVDESKQIIPFENRWDSAKETINTNNFYEFRYNNNERERNYFVRAKVRRVEDFDENGEPATNDSDWSNNFAFDIYKRELNNNKVTLYVEANSFIKEKSWIKVTGLDNENFTGFDGEFEVNDLDPEEELQIGTSETIITTKINYTILNSTGTPATSATLTNPPVSIGTVELGFKTSPKLQIFNIDLDEKAVDGSVISPGSIDGSSLSPNIDIGAKGFNGFALINNDPNISSANTITIGPAGIILKDPSDKDKVSLPTDANSVPLFTGSIIADSLTSTDARLGGASRLPAESTLTLSAGQIKPPLIPPTVKFEYPEEYEWSYGTSLTIPQSGSDALAWNLWLDPDTSVNKKMWTVVPYSGNAAIEWIVNTTTSELERNRQILVSGECHAACRVGNYFYVMFFKSDGIMNINSYTFSGNNAVLNSSQSITVNGYEPTMLPDPNVPNSIIIIDANNSTGDLTGLRIRTFNINTSSTKLPIGALLSTTPVATATITGLSGFANVGSMSLAASFGAQNIGITTYNTLYISVADTVKERILKYSLTRPTSVPNYITGITAGTGNDANFTAAWGEAAAWGIAWDASLNNGNGGFWLHDGLDGIYRTNSSTDVNTYSFGYTFEKLTGTALTYTTTLSTDTKAYTTSIRKPYANVTILANQGFSPGSDSYGFYAKKTSGTAWTDYYLQGRSTTKITLESLGTAGSIAPSSSTFTSGTVASIKSEATAPTSWILYGDGTTSGFIQLGTATPKNLGVATAGTSSTAAKDDHVHDSTVPFVFGDATNYSFTEFTSGTTSTVPANKTYIRELWMVGGGGGGAGGSNGNGSSYGGGGGAGGNVVYARWIPVTAGATFTYSIGAGGTAGTASNDGGAGGDSTISVGTYSFTAKGGSGGQAGLVAANGATNANQGNGVASLYVGIANSMAGANGGSGHASFDGENGKAGSTNAFGSDTPASGSAATTGGAGGSAGYAGGGAGGGGATSAGGATVGGAGGAGGGGGGGNGRTASTSAAYAGAAGGANTGGGGGGGGGNYRTTSAGPGGAGGAGGSGYIAIIWA